MKEFYSKYKITINTISLVLIASVIVYFVVTKLFVTDNSQVINKIEKENKELVLKIKELEDTNTVLKIQRIESDKTANRLENSINKIRQKETIIKEMHYEKVKYIESFDNSDINAYFDNRFGPDSTGS